VAVERVREHQPADNDDRGVDTFANPPEQPSDRGWHPDFETMARIGGWLTAASLVLLATKSVTHRNGAGTVALLLTAGLLMLDWDIHRRRTAGRYRGGSR
jgi:hypothetical protein